AGATSHLPKTDGISIVPTLLGKPGQKRHDFLYWEAAGASQSVTAQAVRWNEWKAIRVRAAGEWQLYNLKTDEQETTNVIAQHPDVMQKINAIIAAEHTPERTYEAAPKESAANYVR
ncbi:MAG: hypothetical protein ACREF9_06910, partial [Opitutaceae bacterium]